MKMREVTDRRSTIDRQDEKKVLVVGSDPHIGKNGRIN